MQTHSIIEPIKAIDHILQGNMLIMIDGKNRENEGDMIIPACFASPEIMRFMIQHGSGIICISLSSAKARSLGLNLLPRFNCDANQANFANPVDAVHGITTGISAIDRSCTIRKIAEKNATQQDFASPGHIPTLIAQDGGVLARAGHTEASIEIAKLAKLEPAMAICEIANQDGTIAKDNKLFDFADKHNLKILYISSLIEYLKQNGNKQHNIQSEEDNVLNKYTRVS